MNKYLAFGVAAVFLIVGGWWFFNQSSIPDASEASQSAADQQTQPTQTSAEPNKTSLVVHGIYSLRARPDLKYLGFSLIKEGPSDPLDDVTQLFFNDEPSAPGNLQPPLGSTLAAIAGDLRPRPSCDLEIEATVEIKNHVFEDRFGENIGNYRIISGDFVRVINRGQVYDVCPVDSGNGITSYPRVPRAM